MNTIVAALVNGILVSAPLTLTVWIALRLMPRRWLNAATRYAIWWAVIAVTVALPFSYLPHEHPRSGPVFATARAMTVSRSVVPSDDGVRLPVSRPSQSSGPSFSATFPIRIEGGPWPSRILFVWIAAAGLMLLRLFVSAILLERRKSSASELLWQAAGRFRVASSDQVSIPLVAGPWRRTILLPTRLLRELSAVDLKQIVIHETAHLTRGDDYALLIQRMIESLFALHPVVWLISANIDLEREIACDDLVIAATGNSVDYASCLARVVEMSGGVRALPMAAAAVEDRSHLASRVKMILDDARHTRTGLLGLRLAAAIGCLGAIAWGAARTPAVLAFTQPTRSLPVIPARATTIPAPRLLVQTTRPAQPVATRPAISATATVFVSVEVRDPLYRYVTGLGPEVFKIQEDGVEQPITEVLGGDDDQADLFVLVDPRLGVGALGPDLNGIALDISNAVIVPVDIGQRLLGDAIRDAGQRARVRRAKRAAMLIVSGDPASVGPETNLAAAVREVNMPVYGVEIARGSSAARPLEDPSLQTGGQWMLVAGTEELPNAVRHMLIAWRNVYYVGYTPGNPARDGSYRTLSLTLAAPRGLPPLTARSRAGYTASTQ